MTSCAKLQTNKVEGGGGLKAKDAVAVREFNQEVHAALLSSFIKEERDYIMP